MGSGATVVDAVLDFTPRFVREARRRGNLLRRNGGRAELSRHAGDLHLTSAGEVRTLDTPPYRQHIDLLPSSIHIPHMDFDISHLLEHWEYQPGQVVVRRFKAKDGTEKLQLRVDLGLLQMNAEGRPDGKRPFGYLSLFEYYQARLYKYLAAHEGSDDGFRLKAEDCGKLQLEALQYHHRYICLLQLEDYAGVIRDAERNLAVFDFVEKHAETEELSWALRQFQPQLMMILTRARGSQAIKADDYTLALRLVEEGIEQIRNFYREGPGAEAAEQSGEVLSLTDWLNEIRAKRPLSKRERLERALNDAVNKEDYERAAKVRDELKNLEPE